MQNDGAICDTDPAMVQSRLADAFKDRFEPVGLEMNDIIKTKAMIVEGTKAPKMQHLIDYINKKAKLIVNAHIGEGSPVPALWFNVAETGTRTTSVKENL
jgi:hypothetical protein